MAPSRRRLAVAWCLLLLVLGSVVTFGLHGLGRSGWELAWHDEFDGRTLDTRRWRIEDRSRFGEANQELACLMDRSANLSLSGGALHLTARPESPGLRCGDDDDRFPQGRPYSSAMISTKDKASWTYGRFEIRARLPLAPGSSQGLWPAFWLRPADGGLGEIDVLEAIGTGAPSAAAAGEVHQSIWYDYSGTHRVETHAAVLPGSSRPDIGFHTYTLEWSPRRLLWSVDHRTVYQRTPATTSWFTEAFSRKFFLRLNLAVGGRYPGSPTSATQLPASFDVDYVRVWTRDR